MSLIHNLVKNPQKDRRTNKGPNDEEDNSSADEATGSERSGVKRLARTAVDIQRLKLEKLMKNPDKPVIIPELRGSKNSELTVPTFVRNVMGSSAGAGSGEFHVYRHLRRKEYARQKMIDLESSKERMDENYHQRILENRRIADEKTAKKRAKRLKKKERAKRMRTIKKASKNIADGGNVSDKGSSATSSSDSDEEQLPKDKNEANDVKSPRSPKDDKCDEKEESSAKEDEKGEMKEQLTELDHQEDEVERVGDEIQDVTEKPEADEKAESKNVDVEQGKTSTNQPKEQSDLEIPKIDI